MSKNILVLPYFHFMLCNKVHPCSVCYSWFLLGFVTKHLPNLENMIPWSLKLITLRVSLPRFPQWISREIHGKFLSRILGDFVLFSLHKRQIFEVINSHDFRILTVYFVIVMVLAYSLGMSYLRKPTLRT